jgi:hypothetical protein
MFRDMLKVSTLVGNRSAHHYEKIQTSVAKVKKENEKEKEKLSGEIKILKLATRYMKSSYSSDLSA